MKSENNKFPRKVIYFEKQSNDRLCGVHCLNSLLQGPYFDPVILSEIGLRLDEDERRLLGNSQQSVLCYIKIESKC
jgi:ataxin-3